MQDCGSTVYMNMTKKIMFIIHLPHSGSYLVAQMVKNPPAIQETWVQSLGWEDPLEKGIATHSSILAWRIPWTEEPGVTKSQTRLSHSHFHVLIQMALLHLRRRLLGGHWEDGGGAALSIRWKFGLHHESRLP